MGASWKAYSSPRLGLLNSWKENSMEDQGKMTDFNRLGCRRSYWLLERWVRGKGCTWSTVGREIVLFFDGVHFGAIRLGMVRVLHDKLFRLSLTVLPGTFRIAKDISRSVHHGRTDPCVGVVGPHK